MYASSARWKASWISEDRLKRTLKYLSGRIEASPLGPEAIGINCGLHFTGGEPFLNFELLLKGVHWAEKLGIPSTFVETNCYWCRDDGLTHERFQTLKNAGLKGLLISVNPFISEEVPFEWTARAVRVGEEIFGRALIVYQSFFYHQFKSQGIKGTLSFEDYLKTFGLESLNFIELIPMGRAVYTLGDLFRGYRAECFFGQRCREELQNPNHVHFDNYGNYMTSFCAGITVRTLRELEQDQREIDLEAYPVVRALATGIEELFEMATREFDYREREGGYISKCHLCLDIRSHLVQKGAQFKELRPLEFYTHLEEGK